MYSTFVAFFIAKLRKLPLNAHTYIQCIVLLQWQIKYEPECKNLVKVRFKKVKRPIVNYIGVKVNI